MDVGALAFGAQMFRIESLFWQIFLLTSMKCPSLSFFDNFWLKVNFIPYQSDYYSLLLWIICLENCFPAFYSEVVSVFVTEVGFLYAAKSWVLFLQPVYQSMSFYWGIESIEILRKSNCCFLLFLLLELEFCSCGLFSLGLLKYCFLAFSQALFPSLY